MIDNIVEFPDRKVVEEEAAAWLVRLDSDLDPTAETLAELHEWLARSPAHREELSRFAAMWSNMNVLTELAVPLGKSATGSHSSVVSQVTGFFRSLRPSVFAAVSCFFVAVTIVFTLWSQSDPLLDSNGVYSTKVGEQLSTVLSDGSRILLNTDSQIVVEYRRGSRDIRLVKGEAAFDVAKNPERPFRVFAGNERVEAVGTAFTVYLQNNKIDVTVTEGRVALATLSQPQPNNTASRTTRTEVTLPLLAVATNQDYVETLSTLIAGQSARIQVQNINIAASPSSIIDTIETVAEKDIARRLSWREGLLTFAGAPLEEVVREISRYTTMSIEITDPAIGSTKIGGTFPVGETDLLLDTLEANFGLRVTRISASHVLLSSAIP